MLDLASAVLVPIDMQQGFDEPSWPKRWNEKVDEHGLRILKAWRAKSLPIIHVRHDSITPNSTLRPGQKGNNFRPGFEPKQTEQLVTKSVNSAFIGTDLDIRLRRLDAKSIIVFGITTDMCVSTTIRTGSNMGWNILLVEDACDCFDLPSANGGGMIHARQSHMTHVATLGFEFCQVTTTEGLLQQLI
jgi:nicotinamidase-related amidase